MNRKEKNVRIKTYGVKGLMEWRVQLSTGYSVKPEITVEFTGGQITGYGVAPARFTTADPFLQRLIEGSIWFKNGKISLLGSKPVA